MVDGGADRGAHAAVWGAGARRRAGSGAAAAAVRGLCTVGAGGCQWRSAAGSGALLAGAPARSPWGIGVAAGSGAAGSAGLRGRECWGEVERRGAGGTKEVERALRDDAVHDGAGRVGGADVATVRAGRGDDWDACSAPGSFGAGGIDRIFREHPGFASGCVGESAGWGTAGAGE